MRVLHVLREDVVGGQQAVVGALLVGNGHIPQAVFCRAGDYLQDIARGSRNSYYGLTLKGRGVLSAARSLRAAVDEFRPDIVHCHDAWASLVAVTARLSQPLVWTWHTDLVMSLPPTARIRASVYRRAERAVARRCEALVAVGEAVKGVMDVALEGVPTPSYLIRNGIAQSPASARVYPAGRPFKVGWIGRMISEKRPLLAVEVAKTLMSSRRGEGLLFVFAGAGPLHDDVTRRLETLALTPRCQWLGEIRGPNVDTFYEGCDVLLFTSTEWEAFGLVPLEAMAHGVPVVATPVGELPYLLRDVEGVIVDAEPRLMADAVLALLESPEKYTTASERCLSRAGVYNVKRMVADYAALYDCLVGGHAFPELPSRG